MLAELFWAFLQIGAFSIGGGYAAVPLLEQQVVRAHAWMTQTEFTDLITIAEMTPGPIFVNSATFVGARLCGIPGALVATLAAVLPSCAIIALLAYLYRKYRTMPLLQRILETLRPAVLMLIFGAGLTILRSALFAGAPLRPENLRLFSFALFAAALFALRRLRLNPILVMLLCGAVNLLVGAAFG